MTKQLRNFSNSMRELISKFFPVGTRSLLFGVHAFWWHPIVVGLAWKKIYRRWPNWLEWVCIFCHDLGYWGKPNMDGPEGRSHPEAGAKIALNICALLARKHKFTTGLKAQWMCKGHSIHFAHGNVSKLYAADKCAVLFDPQWFYLLRASLSGEVWEYICNSPIRCRRSPRRCWFRWYQGQIHEKFTVDPVRHRFLEV